MAEFEVKGVRRMIVALYAVSMIGAVEIADTLTTQGAVAIVGVTLGYYGSKYAEVLKEKFLSMIGK